MAEYHLSVKAVQRSKGQSATAAAAYRGAMMVFCVTEGVVHDYRGKGGVAETDLVGWRGAPESLWNEAEAVEKRKDATVAREYEIALPRELGWQANRALVRRYADWLHARYGVAVQWSIHDIDSGNPHAHLLSTTRVVAGHGLGAKASREWSDTRRQVAGLPTRRKELVHARRVWEQQVNASLAREGVDARVDHRSYAERCREASDAEVIVIPTVHMGPAATWLERHGVRTDRGDLNRAIQQDRDDEAGLREWTAQVATHEEVIDTSSERDLMDQGAAMGAEELDESALPAASGLPEWFRDELSPEGAALGGRADHADDGDVGRDTEVASTGFAGELGDVDWDQSVDDSDEGAESARDGPPEGEVDDHGEWDPEPDDPRPEPDEPHEPDDEFGRTGMR